MVGEENHIENPSVEIRELMGDQGKIEGSKRQASIRGKGKRPHVIVAAPNTSHVHNLP